MSTAPVTNKDTRLRAIVVLCTRHNRKCIISETSTGSLTRIRHMSRVGTASEPCDAAQFIIRYEYEAGRDIAYEELAGIRERETD